MGHQNGRPKQSNDSIHASRGQRYVGVSMKRSGLNSFTSAPQWMGDKFALQMSMITSLPFGIGTWYISVSSECGAKRRPVRTVSFIAIRKRRGAAGNRRAVSRKNAVVYSWCSVDISWSVEIFSTASYHTRNRIFVRLQHLIQFKKLNTACALLTIFSESIVVSPSTRIASWYIFSWYSGYNAKKAIAKLRVCADVSTWKLSHNIKILYDRNVFTLTSDEENLFQDSVLSSIW